MRSLAIALVLVLGAAVRPAGAQTTESRAESGGSSAAPRFEAFRLVLDRNIFDSNRRRREDRRREPEPPRVQAPPTDQVSLVGALIHDEGTSRMAVAFFSGSRSEYGGDRKVGEEIAGYRIAAIRTDRVFLEAAGRRIELPVGDGLRRQSDGPWEIVAGLASSGRSSSPSFSRPSTGSSSAPRGGPTTTERTEAGGTAAASSESSDASAADVLKRLMERRRQETNR